MLPRLVARRAESPVSGGLRCERCEHLAAMSRTIRRLCRLELVEQSGWQPQLRNVILAVFVGFAAARPNSGLGLPAAVQLVFCGGHLPCTASG